MFENNKPNKPKLTTPIDVILLDEIASRLADITKLLEKPEGLVYSINVTVTKTVVIDFLKNYPWKPMFSITLYNDGPDDVYPSINSIPQTITPFKKGETINIDCKGAKIERLYLHIEPGKSAKVRGFGLY